MAHKALYPGTFDPITRGHMNLIERATSLFDEVIVGVAKNPNKRPRFDWDTRIALAREVLSDHDKVTVKGFDTLLVAFAGQQQAQVLLRGLRTHPDFDHECQLARINRQLAPTLETVFLMPAEQYAFISSTLVAEIAELGGEVGEFVHPVVKQALLDHFDKSKRK